MGFGDIGHTLSNTVTGLVDNDWVCTSSFVYSRGGSAGGHDITYNGTNWVDGNSSDWPTHFGTSSTDSTVVTPVGSDTDLYLWSSSTFVCKLVNPDPTTGGTGTEGGSGGGSGGGTVYVQDAKIYFVSGSTGYRFEQRGYPAGNYELAILDGTTSISSTSMGIWALSSQSNDLQHHISNLDRGTYYLWQDGNIVLRIDTRKKVHRNFW